MTNIYGINNVSDNEGSNSKIRTQKHASLLDKNSRKSPTQLMKGGAHASSSSYHKVPLN